MAREFWADDTSLANAADAMDEFAEAFGRHVDTLLGLMRSPFVMAYRDEPLSPGIVADLRALDLEEEARVPREAGFGRRAIRGRLLRLRELREDGMITSSAWRGHIQSGDSW